MKYGYTIIYVEDVKETVEFYQKAFGFQQKFITLEICTPIKTDE